MEPPKRSSQRANGHRLTRRRVPLSCVACRVRKLKCNREKPCQNCIVRGEANAATCTYAEKVEKRTASLSNAEDMRKHINRLESSILSMMSNGEETPYIKSATKLTNDASEGLGPAGGQRISVDTRSTHWNTILNDLGAMKDAWSDGNDGIEFSTSLQSLITKSHRPSLLAGLTPPPDLSTILESIPSKEAADKLVVRFFEFYNPTIPVSFVLHRATFIKQYNQYWAEPTKTKIMWIGLLFAVCCVAMQSYIQCNEEPPEYQDTAPVLSDLYRVRTAQCLIAADITKPGEFMIETMSLYSFTEYYHEKDGDMGTLLISGMMVRLAQQQGYHRDPSQHPNISVFQGEMRRRLWIAVDHHDLVFSVQLGLPRAIRYAECDTEPPRNLHEEELYEDMRELPPARPMTEETRINYQVVKYYFMRAYGQVIEFLNVLKPQPYDEVLKLDAFLLETRELVPPHLRLGTPEEMKHDVPSRVMERYILQLFYHKSICILHRKYWDSAPQGTPGGEWHYSKQACSTSSLELLRHQVSMHKASGRGGCLEKIKWYTFSINNHNFLLAAMILCLDLMSSRPAAANHYQMLGTVSDEEKVEAIQRSRAIWLEIIDDCKDARRAVHVLTLVLRKIATKLEVEKNMNAQEKGLPITVSTANPTVDSLRYSPYFTNQFGLGIPLIGETEQPEQNAFTNENFLDSMASDLTVGADFNWDMWDQFMTGISQSQGHDYLSALQNQEPGAGIGSIGSYSDDLVQDPFSIMQTDNLS